MKVLRFCYGETMKVAPHEVCPVVTAVFRLQLNGAQEVVKKLEDFAVRVAQEDVNTGAAILNECVQLTTSAAMTSAAGWTRRLLVLCATLPKGVMLVMRSSIV